MTTLTISKVLFSLESWDTVKLEATPETNQKEFSK